MKAAVYRAAGEPLVLEDFADPEPGPGDLVVKIHRCGICGTDLGLTSGDAFDFPPGTIPGHEYSGEVVEVGADVSDTRKGDRVTALPSLGCGQCEACRRGVFPLCPSTSGVMGGFGEYVRVPAQVAIRLPGALSLADGAMVEPLAVGLHGVRLAQLQPGDRVLVLGGGTVALCAAYWARRLGAGRVAAISRSQRRESLLLEMGAHAFVQSGEDEHARVAEALGGPPDVVFECVGVAGLLGKGIEHVRPFGQVVSLGFCTAPDPILPALAGMKAVSLQFPVGYTLEEFRYIVDVMDAGHADPKHMITSVISLDELPGVFEDLRGPNQETKVHVAPEGP